MLRTTLMGNKSALKFVRYQHQLKAVTFELEFMQPRNQIYCYGYKGSTKMGCLQLTFCKQKSVSILAYYDWIKRKSLYGSLEIANILTQQGFSIVSFIKELFLVFPSTKANNELRSGQERAQFLLNALNSLSIVRLLNH